MTTEKHQRRRRRGTKRRGLGVLVTKHGSCPCGAGPHVRGWIGGESYVSPDEATAYDLWKCGRCGRTLRTVAAADLP